MSGFVVEWLNLLVRWGHLVVGIGWIGTSFYFVALDFQLRKRAHMPEGVYGTAWLVHGGGFYNVEKYLVAPKTLPPDLIWYKWDAYLTWVTGFALLILQYYWNARQYLIDPTVLQLAPSEAVAISVLSLGGGWLIYDRLCKSPLGRHTGLLALAVLALILGAAWMYGEVYSGRGAFIHVGAFIGTIMAVNVFGVIVPNQRKIAASLLAGEAPDPALGATGKQRSLHNNYLTLPVLLMMVSNHYPLLTGHPYPWLIVALVVLAGGSVRHFINRHEAGDPLGRIWWALPVATAAIAVLVVVTAPMGRSAGGPVPSDAEVTAIVEKHCTMCHSGRPTHVGITEPPKGVELTSLDDLRRYAEAITAQAVTSNAMPLGNETRMSAAERGELGAWLAAQSDH